MCEYCRPAFFLGGCKVKNCSPAGYAIWPLEPAIVPQLAFANDQTHEALKFVSVAFFSS